MFKRMFPTLAEWPPEKWLVLPAVVFFSITILVIPVRLLFNYFGWFLPYTIPGV